MGARSMWVKTTNNLLSIPSHRKLLRAVCRGYVVCCTIEAVGRLGWRTAEYTQARICWSSEAGGASRLGPAATKGWRPAASTGSHTPLRTPRDMYDSAIVVIHKGDKELLLPDSYRPISYSLLMFKSQLRCYSIRLNKAILAIIHPDQTGLCLRLSIDGTKFGLFGKD